MRFVLNLTALLDDQTNYLDLIIGITTDLTPGCMTNMMISTFTLSTFDPCQVIYHLALHMVFTFCRLLHMQDTAHVMMTLYIIIIFQWIDSFSQGYQGN